ncbi:MAG TPA: peptidoglycan editing factor PgeF [Pyrinomonadaceae bacterium]
METITNSVQDSKFKIQNSNTDDEILTEKGFFWREKNGVKVLISRALEENGFTNGFSTRMGGVSPFPENDLNLAGFGEDADENIIENRRRFLNIFEENYTLTTVWQVHGDKIRIVKTEKDIQNTEEKFDALVSDVPNILIGVKTADCVPILLGDRKNKAFAAIHAGWRGTVESIARKAIEKMRENYGTKPQDLICAIGPAASCKNYEVGKDVIDAFEEKFSTSGKLFVETRKNHALIDLHRANKEQLIDSGVASENIFTAPFCTLERTDLFFSYRKEKILYGKTGRLLSVIGIN